VRCVPANRGEAERLVRGGEPSPTPRDGTARREAGGPAAAATLGTGGRPVPGGPSAPCRPGDPRRHDPAIPADRPGGDLAPPPPQSSGLMTRPESGFG